jgi:hypothetical protein
MLKSEVGESRRAPAESFLSQELVFVFGLLCRLFPESSQLAFSIINLPQIGDFQLFLERLSRLILGDFLAKMGDLSDFSS